MESTLALDYEKLALEVARFVGYPRDLDSLTADQLYEVNMAIDGGLRKFYNPVLVGQQMPAHAWSFLRPLGQISLVASVNEYDLPDEFGGGSGCIQGDVTILTTSGSYDKLVIVNESLIRSRRSAVSMSGIPRFVAVIDKAPTEGFPQRWRLLVSPDPDTSYTLQFRYTATPKALSKKNRYPWGGAQHAQTILAACLAEAESKIIGNPGGPHSGEFVALLTASISADMRQGQAEHLGYCGDPSTPESYGLQKRRAYYDPGISTLNGVRY